MSSSGVYYSRTDVPNTENHCNVMTQQQKDLFRSKEKEAYNKAIQTLGIEWASVLWEEFNKDYMVNLSNFVREENKNYTIRPSINKIFRAYRECYYSNVKVVMIGQDPYPHSSADGLAFSSSNGSTPPSLRRIYDEAKKDMGDVSRSQRLDGWAKQGILLLNKSLTVREYDPGSHHNKGWEKFIKATIEALNEDNSLPVAFMLFGSKAHDFSRDITNPDHLVIKASHPARESSYEMNLKDQGYFKELYNFVKQNYKFNLYL